MIVILLLIIIVFIYKKYNIIDTFISKDNNYFNCQYDSLKKCQVPTLNEKQCYLSKYHKCPRINGSYLQCTDNSWSYDGICRCENRTFEMCPYPYKISEKCYQENLKKCLPLTDKERGIIHEPCINPRINIWNSDKYNSMIDNGYILY